MDAPDADPDPAGSIRPTVFYGLWPRFAEADGAGWVDADDPADGEAGTDV
jgi:hypothetical protein